MKTTLPTVLTRAAGLSLVAALALCAGEAGAQSKAANPFQGFSGGNEQPVDVNSESLEVHQDQQMAIFTGNVVAVQGDSTLCAPKLIVYYDNAQDGDATKPAATPGGAAPATAAKPPAEQPGSSSPNPGAIRRLEASGGVVVTSRDQIATGETGLFDMGTNTATLDHNVALTQGNNVIRGKRLVVNLKTGVARIEGGSNSVFQRSASTDVPKAVACTSLAKSAPKPPSVQ